MQKAFATFGYVADLVNPAPGQVLTWQRKWARILAFMALFYIFFNPSWFSLRSLVWFLVTSIWSIERLEWRWLLLIGVVGVPLLITGLWLSRKYTQAKKDTSMGMLHMHLFTLTVLLGVIAVTAQMLAYDRLAWGWRDYLTYAAWTWQILVGYFFGKGLNWAFENFRTARTVSTQEVDKGSHHDGHHDTGDGHHATDDGGHHR